MKGVNLVILLGRLGSDPEVKTLPNGSTVATFNLATSEVWVDKSGEKKERTEWHNIVAWGKLAEIIGKYISKGSEVHVQGKITTRSWEDKESGQKRYKTEIFASQIQFTGTKKGGGDSGGSSSSGRVGTSGGGSYSDTPDYEEPDFNTDGDDNIPF